MRTSPTIAPHGAGQDSRVGYKVYGSQTCDEPLVDVSSRRLIHAACLSGNRE